MHCAEEGDFPGVAGEGVGGFQHHGEAAQGGVVHHAAEGLKPQRTLADAGVTILAGTAGVETVVDVDGPQAVKADDPVERRQHAVQIADDVVPGIGHVAGVEAHPQLLPKRHPVEDLPQLLKPASDLRALAGHGLQQHCGVDFRCQDGVEGVGDQGDAGFGALTGVAAGMEVVEVPRQQLHPPQIVGQRQVGELTGALVL